MKVIQERNVGCAMATLLNQVNTHYNNPNSDMFVEEDTRNGKVLKATTPVTTVYLRPNERVVFDEVRDSNPYFSLLESFWMLAGREDVAFPAYYAKNIENYSDDGTVLNGAYGDRWRNFFGYDQLAMLVYELNSNRACRRAVLQMWNAYQDSRIIDNPLVIPTDTERSLYNRYDSDLHKADALSKDVCCNLTAVFQIRKGFRFRSHESKEKEYLDITVYNRSNDAIWGAYGANAVHFSVLQEFMAYCTGTEIGTYYQVANNFHLYTEVPVVQNLIAAAKNGRYFDGQNGDPYTCIGDEDMSRIVSPTKLFSSPDCDKISVENRFIFAISAIDRLLNVWDTTPPEERKNFSADPSEVIFPFTTLFAVMVRSYAYLKDKDYDNAKHAIQALQLEFTTDGYPKMGDWKTACLEWLDRRHRNYLTKQEQLPQGRPA